ncbi:Trace amine-associated receptor 1 [Biomphalaria glabrata]|nr:trace amine-associated receptor 5-like [Biomphalaria glabrata]
MSGSQSLDNEANTDVDPYILNDSSQLLAGLSVCMILLATLTCMANGTVMLAMVQALIRDAKRGHISRVNHAGNSHITRLLMLSMTCPGVLVGAFIMPLSIKDFIERERLGDYVLCAVRVYVDIFLGLVTNVHNLFLAVDTYVFLQRPFLYRSLTSRTGYTLVAIAWTLPAVILILWISLQKNRLADCSASIHSVTDLDNSTLFTFIVGLLFFLILLAIWAVYLCVVRAISTFVKRPKRNSESLDVSKQEEIPNSLESRSNKVRSLCPYASVMIRKLKHFKTREQTPNGTQKLNAKNIRPIGFILLSFTVCWLPIWMTYYITFFTGLFISE